MYYYFNLTFAGGGMPTDENRSHSFSMPASMLAGIRDMANRSGESMSFVVRVAVRAYFAAQGYQYPPRVPSGDENEPDR